MAYENIFKPNVKKYSIHGASGILVTPTHLCYAICAHICLMFTTNVPRTHMISHDPCFDWKGPCFGGVFRHKIEDIHQVGNIPVERTLNFQSPKAS